MSGMILQTIAVSVAQYQAYLEQAFRSEKVEYVSTINNLVMQYSNMLLQQHAQEIGVKEVPLALSKASKAEVA